MQELIAQAARKVIETIESTRESRQLALQFVLEELDAARYGNDFVRDRIKRFYFNESEYAGAMHRSRDEVDGSSGPQQALLNITLGLSRALGIDLAAAIRIGVVESIARHYGLGRFYLSRKIDAASRPLNLFERLVCDEDRMHPHFRSLMEDENKPIRDVISRWASGFEDRDKKFSHEFQTTFNSSFWEIYLYQCFKDLGMALDFSKAAPDFTVTCRDGQTMNIEAVTANHAHDSEPEWKGGMVKTNRDFLDFACVRILGAIESKHKKFLGSYSKLEHVKGRPFVIAVAPFEQANFFMQNNEAIIRVLYGKGIDKDKNFAEVDTPTALKNGAIPLDLGMFTSEKYKEISAVIFSTVATIGKAITQTSLDRLVRCSRYHETRGLLLELIPNAEHVETHLDGLQVHHNPYAEHKLPPDAFGNYEITHYHYDVPSRDIINQQKSYTIISRNIFPSVAPR